MSALEGLFPPSNVIPVHEATRRTMDGACMYNATFGLPWIWDDGSMDQTAPPFPAARATDLFDIEGRQRMERGFGSFVRQRLKLAPFENGTDGGGGGNEGRAPHGKGKGKGTEEVPYKVGIISRRERRSILNENALIETVREWGQAEGVQVNAEVIDYRGLPFGEQVAQTR